jgi:hypothetical protein
MTGNPLARRISVLWAVRGIMPRRYILVNNLSIEFINCSNIKILRLSITQ